MQADASEDEPSFLSACAVAAAHTAERFPRQATTIGLPNPNQPRRENVRVPASLIYIEVYRAGVLPGEILRHNSPRWPLPPLRPERVAYGVAGLRSRSGHRNTAML
jgi:hypothetical protein